MNLETILRGGRVIDPANGVDAVMDLCFSDGRIAGKVSSGARAVDVSGLVVCPGFIDLHVHLRDPGQTHKEDIASGTRAAAAGGFTSIVAMPNTVPPVDSPAMLREVHALVRDKAVVRVLQSAALSIGRQGEELTATADLAEAGAAALTDDGGCIQRAGLMLDAVRMARSAGLAVLDHCEDESLAGGGAMTAGEVAERLGVSSQPTLAEEMMVARDILIAATAGWPVHVQHVSSAGSVELIRAARQRGIPVTAEASPHHICLTDEWCGTHGANAKMNPPLRGDNDRRAVIEGLRDGTICAIATDHAPHTAEEKSVGFEGAPCGIIGLEAAVSLCLNQLVHGNILDLCAFVARFTTGPRSVLGLTAGTLSVGVPADITILEPDAEHTLRTGDFHSRSLNCPYDGMHCKGRVAGTIAGGEWVFSRLPGVESPI